MFRGGFRGGPPGGSRGWFRGRFRGHRNSRPYGRRHDNDGEQGKNDNQKRERRERRETERHPPGLKGKEIGMWYAARGKARREKEQQPDVFEFEDSAIRDIENVDHILERNPVFKEESVQSKFMESYRRNLKRNAQQFDKIVIESMSHNDMESEFKVDKEKLEAQALFPFRKKLPAYQKREEVSKLIQSNQVVVISGETGR